MKKGDRVKFSGRKGTVVRSMPNGMIDIRFDDSTAIERRSAGRLARANPSGWRDKYTEEQALRLKFDAELFFPHDKTLFSLPIHDSSAEFISALDKSRNPLRSLRGLEKRIRSEGEKSQGELAAEERFRKRKAGTLETRKEKRKPKEHKGAPPKRKQLVGKFDSAERVSPLGYFTKADPPRINKAQTAYCGNPIDGTAYYAFLPSKTADSTQWVTDDDIKSFVLAGMSVPEAVAAYVKSRKEQSPEGTIVDSFSTPVGRQGVQSFYVEKKKHSKKSQGVQKRVPPETVTQVISPSGETKYFADEGTTQKREVVVSFDPQTAAKMRGKHAQRGRTVRGRDWDDPSLYTPKGKSIAPINAAVGETQDGPVNYKIKTKEVPSSTLKRNYNFYRERSYVVRGDGPELYQFVSSTVGVDHQTAAEMIWCQMVTVYPPGQYRGGETPSDPRYYELEAGYRITISDKAKANSPFFSFVRVAHSPTNQRQRFAPCFSNDEKADIKALQQGARALKRYSGALKSAAGLFDHDKKVTKAAPAQRLQNLLRAYTAVNSWWDQLDYTETLKDRIEAQAPLADLGESSLLSKSLHDLRGIAFSGTGTVSLFADQPQQVVQKLFDIAKFSGIAPPRSMFQTETARAMFAAVGIEPALTPGVTSEAYKGEILKIAQGVSGPDPSRPPLPIESRRVFYALLVAYYALGGSQVAEAASAASQQVRDLSASLQGGEAGFGGTGQIVLMTYNPLLFQLLQRTWKTTFSLERHPDYIKDVDAIGRLGASVRMVHEAEVQGIPLGTYLYDQFAPAEKVGKKQMERSNSYTNALLFWPLGAIRKPTFFDEANAFIGNPLGYIKHLKRSLPKSMLRTSRSTRLPKTETQPDWPYEPKGRISRATASLIEKDRVKLQEMIQAVDRRIKAVRRKR